MLVLATILNGEEPLRVPLWHLNLWIQIHDLPIGLMTESVRRQLGNFFGEFLEYDNKNNTSIWRESMRIKIKIDVRRPLKRMKKITRRNGTNVVVTCKYERLGDFCFTCGIVSHTDRYCRKFLDKKDESVTKEWGSWLRATSRRMAGPVKSKWLRDEGDTNWEERIGRFKTIPKSGESSCVGEGNQLS